MLVVDVVAVTVVVIMVCCCFMVAIDVVDVVDIVDSLNTNAKMLMEPTAIGDTMPVIAPITRLPATWQL